METSARLSPRHRRDIRQFLNAYIAALMGTGPDPYGVHDVFWNAFGHALAVRVHSAFVTKSQHGTDDLGQKWDDHSPQTKAYSRPDAREHLSLPGLRAPKGSGWHSRPTLTAEQNREWAWLYATQLEWLQTQMSEDKAKLEAGKFAWATLKKKGAKTLLDLTRGMKLLLLQKSRRLIESLAPGDFSGERYIPPRDQIFRVDRDGLTYGTRIEYAERVSRKRPIWPEHIDPWITIALDAGIDAVVSHLKTELER